MSENVRDFPRISRNAQNEPTDGKGPLLPPGPRVVLRDHVRSIELLSPLGLLSPAANVNGATRNDVTMTTADPEKTAHGRAAWRLTPVDAGSPQLTTVDRC